MTQRGRAEVSAVCQLCGLCAGVKQRNGGILSGCNNYYYYHYDLSTL